MFERRGEFFEFDVLIYFFENAKLTVCNRKALAHHNRFGYKLKSPSTNTSETGTETYTVLQVPVKFWVLIWYRNEDSIFDFDLHVF